MEYTVKLTASEIEALLICICSEHLILEEDVSRLLLKNETGIHNHKIELKKNCMEVCDRLWDKLYAATKEDAQ